MKGPLQGLRVLVTRPGEKGLEQARLFEAQGALAPILPTIEYIHLTEEEAAAMDEALVHCDRYDAVVFTSFQGVLAAHRRALSLGPQTIAQICTRELIVVGSSTAEHASRAFRTPDLVPQEFSTAGLLRELTEVEGKRFLLLRGSLAGADLPDGLRERGAIVDDVLAYRVEKTEGDPSGVLSGPRPDYLTFASASAFASAMSQFEKAGVSRWIDEIPMVCIGKATLECIRDHGYDAAAVADPSTSTGLVEAVVNHHLERVRTHA